MICSTTTMPDFTVKENAVCREQSTWNAGNVCIDGPEPSVPPSRSNDSPHKQVVSAFTVTMHIRHVQWRVQPNSKPE